VHNKQVRRRRAVVAALVAVSLILLTAYFGESPSSPLHTLQRGIVEVFSPIQEGASKVLSPFRDVASFFSDTFKAKSQVGQLRKQVHKLQAELAQSQYAVSQNAQLRRQVGLDNSTGLASYKPVASNVISRDPTLWYATVEIDKGSDDGIHRGDPATADGALVGQVTTVDPTVSFVTLITDHTMAVAAQAKARRDHDLAAAAARLAGLIDKLVIHPQNMRNNLDRLGGLIHSQRVMLALTQKGVAREEAYRLVQRNAMKAWSGDGDFGALLAAGITAWVVGQALIHIGAVIGVLPVTGVPLPFVSFGGSSLVITMGAAGILLNIARQTR